MLNLFGLFTRNTTKSKSVVIEKDLDYYKNFPVSTREWDNSIYVFNKISLILIPQATASAMYIIRGYLNLYNTNLERSMRKTRLLRRFRRLSSNKIYVSHGEFKHTNDKVVISLYTYNRQRFNYIHVLKKRYLRLFYKNKLKSNLKKTLYFIKDKGFKYMDKISKDKITLISISNKLKVKNESLYINPYLIEYCKRYVKKSLNKLKFYLFYKQLLYINESKFNYTYLQILNSVIQNIYNKKVEFNLINLKYHYLNCDILSESLTLKITRNRKKLLRHLNKLIWKIKTHKIPKNIYDKPNNNRPDLIENINDPLESLFKNKKRGETKHVKQVVLDEIKYKRLGGVRLEANGRLGRRYTASRSVNRLKYEGNLINLDSSYKGLSSVILKGNLRANLQYSKFSSKTRIGSFGIKGFVSGN